MVTAEELKLESFGPCGEGEMQGKWVGFEISDEQKNMAGEQAKR